MKSKANCPLTILVVLILFLTIGNRVILADDYTFDRPISFVIPYGPGGSHDIHARFLSSVAPAYLDGQPLVVELRPGGGGAIGTNYVKNAKPDGYTLLFTQPGAHTLLPLIEDVGYTNDDFEPIASINHGPTILSVRAEHPSDTFDEFVEWIVNLDREPIWGSTVVWGNSSLPALLLHEKLGFKDPFFRFLLYDGVGETIRALLAGELDFVWQILSPTWRELAKDGRTKILAISSEERDPRLPEVPTLKESGYDIVLTMYRYIFVPKGTPNNVKQALTEAFRGIVQDPTFLVLMDRIDEPIVFKGAEELDNILKVDEKIYANLIEKLYVAEEALK